MNRDEKHEAVGAMNACITMLQTGQAVLIGGLLIGIANLWLMSFGMSMFLIGLTVGAVGTGWFGSDIVKKNVLG